MQPFVQTNIAADIMAYRQHGIAETVSDNNLTDTSAGPVYYIHPTTGELVTVAATEVLNHPTLGPTSLPVYEQLCQDSEDPGEWVLHSGATRSATGETFGPFIEYNIIDATSVSDTARFWNSSVSGDPAGILYFSVRYRAGTSGKVRLRWNEVGVGTTDYSGTIGSAGIVSQGTSGTLTIISDEYDSALGYYTLKCSMLFDALNGSGGELTAGIGPCSEDNSNIKVLGADVSENRAILDFHVPSGVADGTEVSSSWNIGTFDTLVSSGLDITSMTSDAGTTESMHSNSFASSSDSVLVSFTVGGSPGTNLDLRLSTSTSLNGSVATTSALSVGDYSLKLNPTGTYTYAGFRASSGSACNASISNFSIQKLTSDVTIASRAGTISASEGRADGVELAPTGTCTDPANDQNVTTGWADNAVSLASIAGGVTGYALEVTGNDTNANVQKDLTLVIGTIYRFSFYVKAGTEATYIARVNDGVSSYGYDSNTESTAAWVKHTFDFTAAGTSANIKLYSRAGGAGLTVLYDNVTLQKVPTGSVMSTAFPKLYTALSEGEFKMSGTWIPGVDYGDVGANAQVISVNGDIFLYNRTGGRLQVYDGVNASVITFSFTAGTPYPFEIIAGYNTALAADKMELNVYVSGAWQTAIADFDGSFNPTTDMIYGLNNPYQSSIKDLKVQDLRQSHWR